MTGGDRQFCPLNPIRGGCQTPAEGCASAVLEPPGRVDGLALPGSLGQGSILDPCASPRRQSIGSAR